MITLPISDWDYKGRYYSEILSKLGYHSLEDKSSDSSIHQYRFIWERTFHDMIVITINVLENDYGELHFQKFCKLEPITEDDIVIDSHLKLFPPNIYNLLNVIDKYDFWNTPTKNPYPIGLDGSTWVIEGLRNGIYHYIERWWPLQHENVASGIGLKMLGLSRVKIDIIY